MCSFLGKFLIIVMNLALLLLSAAMVTFGVLMAWYPYVIVNSFLALNLHQEPYQAYALPVGVWLFSIGLALFVASFIGFFGATCRSFGMMTIYAIVIGLVCAASISVLIIFLVDSTILTDPMQHKVASELQKNFDDPDNPRRKGNFTNIVFPTSAIVRIFRELPCCGAENYEDFKSPNWYSNYTYNVGDGSQTVEALVPVMCCRSRTSVTESFQYYVPTDIHCLDKPNATNSYINIGCFTQLNEQLQHVVPWILTGTSVGLLLVFVFAVQLAHKFRTANEKDKKRRAHSVFASASEKPQSSGTLGVAYYVSRPTTANQQPYYLVSVKKR